MRRTVIVAASGLIVAAVLLWFVPWGIAVVTGWDVARARFPPQCLANHHPSRRRARRAAGQTRRPEPRLRDSAVAGRECCQSSWCRLALTLAGHESGALQVLLIGFAVLTVVLSWTVLNTVFTLRDADLHFGSGHPGIDFEDSDQPERPTYRDFAYVAFTIGMCYQVSDTTIRDRPIRRTVLGHALLSYMFGAAIVGGSVNLIAGLIR